MHENLKKAGLASAFVAAVFAVGVAAAAVSPASAETVSLQNDAGSFSTRVQDVYRRAESTGPSGYYAYAPNAYAEMGGTSAQAGSPSTNANGSFSSRIQDANHF